MKSSTIKIMEKELNIAAILKDKPKGIKLFDTLRGIDVCLDSVGVTLEHIYCTGDGCSHYYTNTGGFSDEYPNGMQILKPSKEIQDWSKFAWKKGDVLVCRSVSPHIYTIFDHFTNDDYTKFYGRFHYLYEYREDRGNTSSKTTIFEKISDEKATRVISSMEKHFGGKLNLETLEIEKPEPQFKDGDIVQIGDDAFVILKEIEPYKVYYHYYYKNGITNFNDSVNIAGQSLKLASKADQLTILSHLKKYLKKQWDADKKVIVDLPKMCEFKPMDWCLMKYKGHYNNRGWELCQYAYTEHRVSPCGKSRDFYHSVGGTIYAECIPYNDQTAHLLGTTDDWKGGE